MPISFSRVFLVFLAATLHAMLYGFLLIPPWQAPDEPGHVEYVLLLSAEKDAESKEGQRPAIQQAIISSLAQQDFWHLLHRETPDPLPAAFSQDPYLIGQWDDEPPLYYLVPALIARAGSMDDPLQVLYLLRAWSALLFGTAAAFVSLGLGKLFREPAWPIAGGLMVALLPMPAFIGGTANNDAGGMAAGALAFYLLLRTVGRKWTGARALGVSAALLLALFVKKTTLFLWPTAVALALWRGKEMLRPAVRRRPRLAALGVLLLAGAVAGASLVRDEGRAADWVEIEGYRPAARAVREDGGHALVVEGSSGNLPAVILQERAFDIAELARGERVSARVLVRGMGGVGKGFVGVYDGTTSSRQPFHAGEDAWLTVEVSHSVADTADRLGLVVANSGGVPVFVDDVAFELDGTAGSLLYNGDAEAPAHPAENALVRWLGIPPGQVPHPFEPASYRPSALRRYLLYVLLTFAGFWANFGWLTLPLAPPWYLVPALLCAVAAAGLLRGVCRRRGAAPRTRRLWGAVALAALFAGVMVFLPMIGSAWQPQGRYFFPALLPLIALFLQGWCLAMPARGRTWAPRFLVMAALAFDQMCIWGYLIPYYGLPAGA